MNSCQSGSSLMFRMAAGSRWLNATATAPGPGAPARPRPPGRLVRRAGPAQLPLGVDQHQPGPISREQLLAESAICCRVELDGGVIGTLDIYARKPRGWDPSGVAAPQAHAGLVASLLSAAVTAEVKGRLAGQLQAALEHRWLIEQAKGVLMAASG